ERVRLDRRLRGLHDVARGFGERVRPARADQHLDALAGERARRLQADALAAAGDERGLACEPEIHRATLPPPDRWRSPDRTPRRSWGRSHADDGAPVTLCGPSDLRL